MRKIKTVKQFKIFIKRENNSAFNTMEKLGCDEEAAKEWFLWAGNYAYKTRSGVLVFVEGDMERPCPFMED